MIKSPRPDHTGIHSIPLIADQRHPHLIDISWSQAPTTIKRPAINHGQLVIATIMWHRNQRTPITDSVARGTYLALVRPAASVSQPAN